MAKSDSPFSLHIEAGVAHIVLCRPEKANALAPDFWLEFPKLVDEISQSASARCIVISSEGKHFTAGIDLQTLANLPLGKEGDPNLQAEAFLYDLARLQNTFNALERARMPVIAAVHGTCIGAGIDMISACDIRLCTEEAWFCIHEINVGMTADVGTFPRVTRLLPDGWMRQMAYTGEKLDAANAERLGFVNKVYATQEELVEGALELAKQIASRDPLAVTGSKEIINYSRDHSTHDSLRYIGVWNAGMLSPDRLRTSIAAQMQKTTPTYPDLMSVVPPQVGDDD